MIAQSLMNHNATQPTARVIFQPNGRQGDIDTGTTLLDAARELGVEIESICGGYQTCGKCKVVVEQGDFAKFGVRSGPNHLTPPDEREVEYAARRKFAMDERLSCACQVTGDVVIRVPEESQTRKQVVRKQIGRKGEGVAHEIRVDAAMRLYYVELPAATLKDHRGDAERLRDALREVHALEDLHVDPMVLRTLQPTLVAANREVGKRAVTVTVWHGAQSGNEIVRVQPGFVDDVYGMAIDVGTTTVAGHLCHLRTGAVLATASRMNPQVPFGEDLMSRVSYAMMHDGDAESGENNGTQRMHDAIIEGLNGVIADACAEAGLSTSDLVELVIVGNTTMHHLLLGIDPRELGGAPFSLVTHDAVDIKARDLGLRIAPGGNVHVPPCQAGHVGADNVAVLVAESPYTRDEIALVIDIGTNGEILLGNRERVLSASSPMGPAFEGAQIVHGMRAAPGAMERIRIDPATLAVKYRIIGEERWFESERASEGAGEQGSKGARVTLSAAKAEPKLGTSSRITHHASRVNGQSKRDAILNPPLRPSGICGSGIIEAIAELFKAGVIAPNGRFVEIEHERLRTGLGDGGGKAEFVLAWPHETSSGRAITVHSDDVRAIQLGKAALYAGTKLLMGRMNLSMVDRIVLAGGFGSYIDPTHAMILGLIPDCALDKIGAVGNAAGDGARMILLDRAKRAEAIERARWVTYIETAVEPSFQVEFVGAINIPHASDDFPHLETMLTAARAQWSPERRLAVEAMSGGGGGERGSRADRAARRAARSRRRA